MSRPVLIAIDASPACAHLLDLVRRYCRPDQHHLHVLLAIDATYAIHPKPAAYTEGEQQEYPAACEEQHLAERAVNDAVAALRQSGFVCEGSVVAAEPVDAIVGKARALDCELIVMGHRHLSRLGRLLDPSVSAKVIERVGCPVLLDATSA